MTESRRLLWTGIAVLSVGGIAATAASASFPGKNGSIVFSSTRDGSDELYAMAAPGPRPRRIPRTRPAASTPAVSRDGRWIAFERYNRRGKGGTREIYVTTVAGRKPRRLTRNVFD